MSEYLFSILFILLVSFALQTLQSVGGPCNRPHWITIDLSNSLPKLACKSTALLKNGKSKQMQSLLELIYKSHIYIPQASYITREHTKYKVV